MGEEGIMMNCSQQAINEPFVFLPLSISADSSISSVTTIQLSNLFPPSCLSLLFSLSFTFFPLMFWNSSPLCALFPFPGMVDRDPRVRPTGCGRHAAGQQGKTLLPTLVDGQMDS